jgi:glycerol-3-phosphate cytidylyltransferase
MNIVYTGGTFDLFHSGHVNLLKKCRDIAGTSGRVIVGLNTDRFIEEYKGKAPVCDQNERAMVLAACCYVDEVILNVGGFDSKPAIEIAKPNFIVIGSDWVEKNYYKQMGFDQSYLDTLGISLVYVPYTQNISTTEIKNRLL